MTTPVEAACTAPSSSTCSGALSAADFTGITLSPNLTMVFDPTRPSRQFEQRGGLFGAAAGPLILTIDAGAQQDAGGVLTFDGDITKAGNTAVVDNLGTFQDFNIGQEGSSFGGLVTLTNESAASLADLEMYSGAGSKLTNVRGRHDRVRVAGLRRDLHFDPARPRPMTARTRRSSRGARIRT